MCSLAKEHLLTRQVPFSNSQVPVKCPEYPVLRGFYGWEEVLSRLNPAEPVDNWRVMSPTSYQAAPPRTVTISDGPDSVKPAQAGQGRRLLFSDSMSENYH